LALNCDTEISNDVVAALAGKTEHLATDFDSVFIAAGNGEMLAMS